MSNRTRVLVWGEHRHERIEPHVAAIYPDGMHTTIAAGIVEHLGDRARVRTTTEPEWMPTLASIGLDRTDAGHIASSNASSSQASRFGGYDARPTGIAVNLEDEMIKVAANQMDYQAATTLYTKSLGLIKIAIGKR